MRPANAAAAIIVSIFRLAYRKHTYVQHKLKMLLSSFSRWQRRKQFLVNHYSRFPSWGKLNFPRIFRVLSLVPENTHQQARACITQERKWRKKGGGSNALHMRCIIDKRKTIHEKSFLMRIPLHSASLRIGDWRSYSILFIDVTYAY